MRLGIAWWAFADERNKKSFRELQRDGEHLGLQRSLEIDLIARLDAGELEAIGIEGGTDAGPIALPQYYFSKTARVDWDNETVEALGKKFYEITVQGDRESPDETPQSEPAPSNKPQIGRPLLLPKVREVVRELIDRDEFANLSKKEIENLVRGKAKRRFPASFPKPLQSSKNTINQAIRAEGWPPAPAK